MLSYRLFKYKSVGKLLFLQLFCLPIYNADWIIGGQHFNFFNCFSSLSAHWFGHLQFDLMPVIFFCLNCKLLIP